MVFVSTDETVRKETRLVVCAVVVSWPTWLFYRNSSATVWLTVSGFLFRL